MAQLESAERIAPRSSLQTLILRISRPLPFVALGERWFNSRPSRWRSFPRLCSAELKVVELDAVEIEFPVLDSARIEFPELNSADGGR